VRLDHITPKQFGVRWLAQRNITYTRLLQLPEFGNGVRLNFSCQCFILSNLTAEEKLNLTPFPTSLPGGYSEWEPPDPIPNSEVKLLSADDSVGFPHVKVGHRQALIAKPR
jgi:hypothetical protein